MKKAQAIDDWKEQIRDEVKYWHTENLSTIPETKKYATLLSLNEPVLISNLINLFRFLATEVREEERKLWFDAIKSQRMTSEEQEVAEEIGIQTEDILNSIITVHDNMLIKQRKKLEKP